MSTANRKNRPQDSDPPTGGKQPTIGEGDPSIPDAPSPNPLAGTKYKAVAQIGRGGMGEVFLADHIEVGKRFVVKLLLEEMASDPRLVDRMRVEAQSLAKLRHPSIVDVTDFGTTPGGRPYLVMERLTGTTLADDLRQRGALGVHEAVSWVRQVLSALAATHAIGIIHRDIKLSNLFVHHPAGGAPVLKVLDFGLAKVVDGAPDAAPKPLQYPTEEGVVLGTPRYLAPEAWAGKGVDQSADIYATGTVLYHLLCGRSPWQELKQPREILQAQLAEQFDPPSMHAPGPIPVELDWIVRRALSAKPSDRFQSAGEFDQALATLQKVASAPTGWMHTTVLNERPPADVVPEKMEARSDSTDRDLPPTLESPRASAARGPVNLSTEKLSLGATNRTGRVPPGSTRTALSIEPVVDEEPVVDGEPVGNAPVRATVNTKLALGVVITGALVVGLLVWMVLQSMAGP